VPQRTDLERSGEAPAVGIAASNPFQTSPPSEPMTNRRGNRYERELSEEITPQQIAALLTKKIRDDLGWSLNDFNRPLRLPKEKLI
jgi:hypothetical protein